MKRPGFLPYASLLAALSLACGRGSVGSDPTGQSAQSTAARPASATEESAGAEQRVIIVLGDSLAAGLGVAEDEAFPALAAAALRRDGFAVRLVNAGVSGDTTAGGLSRLPWLLTQEPDVVVVELGANDGLRGLSLTATEANLDRIVGSCQAAGARVLLVGMRLPPSYGPEYSGGFEQLYPRVAGRHRVDWMPFLLEGVAAVPELNQADGIHPNAAGHARIAVAVTPYLAKLLRELDESSVFESLD